ncbi:hypothetical protein K466DRAFT_602910 [Polyporus arcularius HHB13444]|uniref:Uncharacterized protein n=1 Tax=Polyporus arcularius HHB13444 TaxID=1314778 RepID=A0A5C3P444_9APHY|nr:hypothetical protein K466DRAFT_602910 [Polyporus arcularius HHB13444]
MPPTPPLSPADQDMVQPIDATIVFECEDHIRDFFQNISENNEQFCAGIRGLHFAVGTISHDAAAMLKYCIAECGKLMPLKHLHFDEAEDLLASDPGLVNAFAALTTVKKLHIANVGEHASDMLMEMKSSIVSAELSLSYDRKWGLPDDAYYSDPTYLMSASHATLEKLKASWATVVDAFCQPRYTSMRRLQLDFVDGPRTYDYVVPFPNLQYLTVSSYALKFYKDENVLASADSLRRANQKEQEEHGSWRALIQVTGPLIDVYMLGLSCFVHTMDLVTTRESEDHNVSMLESALADGTPNILRLTTSLSDITVDGIVFALNRENTVRLHELKLIVKVDPGAVAYHIRETVDSISSAMRDLRIRFLYLRFEVQATTRTGTQPETNLAASQKPSYLATMNLKLLGSRLIGRVSSLERVRVSVVGLGPGEDAIAILSSTEGARMVMDECEYYSESDGGDDSSTSSESDEEGIGAQVQPEVGFDEEEDEEAEDGQVTSLGDEGSGPGVTDKVSGEDAECENAATTEGSGEL